MLRAALLALVTCAAPSPQHTTDDPPEPAGFWTPALPAPPEGVDPRLVSTLAAGCNASHVGDDCGPVLNSAPVHFVRAACAYAFGLAAGGGALYCPE
jgi:hypothetical protein